MPGRQNNSSARASLGKEQILKAIKMAASKRVFRVYTANSGLNQPDRDILQPLGLPRIDQFGAKVHTGSRKVGKVRMGRPNARPTKRDS